MNPPVVSKDKLGREVKDLSVVKWWGIDRKEIKWFPEIDYDACIGCGVCFVTCGRRVFDWDTELGKPVVAMPYNCMVACQTCANLCPSGAIKFPSKDEVKHLVAKAGVVKKAFEMIEPITKIEKNTEGVESKFNP